MKKYQHNQIAKNMKFFENALHLLIFMIDYKQISYIKKCYNLNCETQMFGEQSWMAIRQPVWIYKGQKFIKGIIKQIHRDLITCSLQDGQSIKIKKQQLHRRNPIPADITRFDLMDNSIINQPQILNNINIRYANKKIYTYLANILISVNPYQNINQLYTEEIKNFYISNFIQNSNHFKQYQPHVYAVVAQCVKLVYHDHRNQTIVVTGESGSGKTQINKECFRFIAHYFKRYNSDSSSSMQKTITLLNPLLQQFGNAKTIRNVNSSRFGKYISIKINTKSKTIKQIKISNYLLQKSRVINRAKEQQNFHIFYQFISKTTKIQKQKYNLINQQNKQQLTYQDFQYTKNTQQIQYLNQTDTSYQKYKQSLTILPDTNSYDYICKILSAILHIGNLQPIQDDDQDSDGCQILPSSTFEIVCQLLQVDKKYLSDSLTSYTIKIGGEDLIKTFSKKQVQELMYSLSKCLYQGVFNWIINQINSITKFQQQNNKCDGVIGMVDMYGFQVLKTNSLEQLFINLFNQKIHYLYLYQIFKLEKQQFYSQKLEYKFKQVHYQDNCKVIQLIDNQQYSIINLLDQWCAVASPDQGGLVSKIRNNHKKHSKFPPNNTTNLLSTQFMIRHTPQDITYSVLGFRQKNKDILRQQIKIVMRSSKLKILQEIFKQIKIQNDLKINKTKKFLTSKFRNQINQLIEQHLNNSQIHYIRCIKPNQNKAPLKLDEQFILTQMRYLSIIETIKIKKNGYSTKLKYQDIDRKFSWMMRNNYFQPASASQVTSAIKTILPRLGQDEMLFGISKIFFKQYAYTMFLNKYEQYEQYLNQKAHKIISLFMKIVYIKKKQRCKKKKIIIHRYLICLIQLSRIKKRKHCINILVRCIKKFIVWNAFNKKIQNLSLIQAYIKRNIYASKRINKLHFIQKVVLKFKYLIFRKQLKARIVSKHIIQQIVLTRSWKTIIRLNIDRISNYCNGILTQLKNKNKIKLALLNQHKIIQRKSLSSISLYLNNYLGYLKFYYYRNKIVLLQSNIRTYLLTKQLFKNRSLILFIQRAIRQYLCVKRGIMQQFDAAYSNYSTTLSNINHKTQQQLYDSSTQICSETGTSIRKFLSKFKQKISLLYYIIDFQTFIDLDLVYTRDSWIKNYLKIFYDGLDKNDPLQFISIGETFTVAANTNKLYLWGMHDNYKHVDQQQILEIKTKMPVQFYYINKNKLNFSYIKDNEQQKKGQSKRQKLSYTITKDYILQNGKLYQYFLSERTLIKGIPQNQKVLQISCGKAHTILRTSAKKVYTFGYGREGQLGHSICADQEQPKSIKFFQNIKSASAIQVSASFTGSLVLLSNLKLYWFGKNSTLSDVSTPTLLELKSKAQILSGNQFAIGRVLTTWSRTMSVIGVTVVCYNGQLQNNTSLRNKITHILISKWQQVGINNINPPLVPSISDYFQQCHVKLRSKKINIHPESKTNLKQMQEKVKSMASLTAVPENITNRNSIGTEFSFANTLRNSLFK